MNKGNKIIKKIRLNDTVSMMEVEAKDISRVCEPGQFIILRVSELGERIPLTISDFNREKGTITIIYQIVGLSTNKLDLLEENDYILDLVGPLGKASEIDHNMKKAVVIGGGVGSAIAYPICKKIKNMGIDVISINGFRSKDLVILEEEFKENSALSMIYTNDGTYGYKGFVTDGLEKILSNEKIDCIYTIGPLVMMKAVSNLSRKYNTKTIASMNPIMIDGTGMCGGCRLSVSGKTKFACVDGPEFDAHEVDFDELIERNKFYHEIEEKKCNLFKAVKNNG